MHRNTTFLLVALALVAALLLGIKVNIWMTGGPRQILLPSPIPSPLSLKTYTSQPCGITFEYPTEFTLQESTGAARLTSSKETVDVACASTLPKPPLPKEKIETITVASISATIFHDASTKDKAPRDVVIFTHPKKRQEVALFGYGEVFQKILSSLKLL